MIETTLRQDLEAIASGMTGDRTPAGIAAIALEKLNGLPPRNWKKSGTIQQSFRTVLVEIDGRKYDTNRITEASFKRLRAVLNDPSVEKIVELDDYDLTPTVYFYYGKLK